MNANNWFAAGRLAACIKMPYFASAVLGLVPHQMPNIGTMGITDTGVLYWDPALAIKWTVENLAWVLLHEAEHYLREHGKRAKQVNAEPSLWNIATDAENNDDLVAAGAAFPRFTDGDGVPKAFIGTPSGVTPTSIGCRDGKLAEEYYVHLKTHVKIIDIAIAGFGKKGKKCGSGAGAPNPDIEGQIPKELDKTEIDQAQIKQEVAEAIRQHIKDRGTVPAGLKRWADETLGAPRVPWQQKLARACRRAIAYRSGMGDYRYDRPSRRQSAFGYGTGSPVFPALRAPIPRCAVIIDTSGSMGEAELQTGLEEIKGILSAVGTQVDFFACDAEVHEAKKIRNVSEVKLTGGGGTDMRPAFAAVEKLSLKLNLVVCVTDGQIGSPGKQPRGIHVIWLIVGQYANTKPASWGEVIVLD